MSRLLCEHMSSFLWYMPESGIAGSHGKILCLIIWGTTRVFSNHCTILCCHQFLSEDSNFFTSSPTLIFIFLFLILATPGVWSGISLWFWFAFSWDIEHLLFFGHYCVFVEEISLHIFFLFLNWSICLFIIELKEFFESPMCAL